MTGNAKGLTIYALLILLLFTKVSGIGLATETRSKLYPNQPIQFQSITVKDGLSFHRVRKMTQDSYGFMWFGTDEGVDRYDGQHITPFRNNPEDPTSLLPGVITSLLSQPEEERIWVGSRNGLCHIDVKTFKITRINLGPYNDIRTLAWDRSGGLWIGAQNTLLHLDLQEFEFEVYDKDNSKLSNNLVRSIYEDSSGNLWVGTFDKLNRLDKQLGEFQAFDLKGDYDHPIRTNHILTITPYSADSDSLLWIGTETGLCLFDRYNETFQVYRKGDGSLISNDKVVSVFVEDSLNIWVGTDFGLNLFNVQTKRSNVFYHLPKQVGSLSNNKIYSIFEDQAGNIWFATDNGVNLLDRTNKPFLFYPVQKEIDGQSVGIEVNNIVSDESGHFWLNTYQGVIGFSTTKGIFQTFKHQHDDPFSLLADKSLDLYFDEFDKIWIATNKGLNVWDPGRSVMHSFSADLNSGSGLKSHFTYSLVRAGNGSFWIGTWDGGIHKITGNLEDMNTIGFKQVFNLDSDFFVSDQEALWIAVAHREVYRMNLHTEHISIVEPIREVLGGKKIHSMVYTKKGSLWLGCENGLLEYVIHDNQAHFYPLQSAKAPLQSGRDLTLRSTLEDNRGNIWCSSTAHIIKFDVKGKQFEVFPVGKELNIDGFLPGSCCKTATGELVFAGQDGFVVFDPDAVSPGEYQSTAGIGGLYIQNERVIPGHKIDGQQILERSIFFEDEITLRFNHRSLMFSFASLNYNDLSDRIFAYKLEGYDDGWRYTYGNQSFAVYSNLPSGNFTFMLKGSYNESVSSENISSLQLRIKPPVWASPGAIVLYVIIVLVLSLLVLNVYHNKAKWLKRLGEIRVEKEQNEAMALLKQRLFNNISHEFRTPLCLISGPVQEILEKNSLDSESRKLAEIISKNSGRMLRLVNQLIDFRKMEIGPVKLHESNQEMVELCYRVFLQFSDQAERKNIEYSFISGIEKLESSVDAEKLETVLFNLLSNAFNFTPVGGNICMKLDLQNGTAGKDHCSQLMIRVVDSGPGISLEDQPRIFDRFFQSENGKGVATGSGIGLTIVKEYMELFGGNVSAESVPGQGSTFEITLPIHSVETETGATSFIPETSKNKGKLPETLEEQPVKEKMNFAGNPVILLVEDNPEVIDYISLGLAEKYTFRLAENGKVALQMVEQEIPDLIISDVMMPEMDGNTLCMSIKENPRTNHIPFILLSALTLTDQQIEGIKSGADAYLTKPFIIKYLDALIENLFHRKELLVEYARMQIILNPSEITVTSTEEKILNQVITFIESHLSDPELSVKYICKATGFTYSYLFRTIKKITGGTLNELIRDIRIKRAAQLLKSRKLTIAEVMVEVGFSSHSYFSKCFRRVFKMSPGNYLQSLH